MASMPFALSVHSLVSSVGADAGFAAVIGLAILALLYFAHARETASLREEAALLAQRLAEAEANLAASRRAPAQAAQAAPVAPAPHSAPALSPPFAPAGMAAPALTAATRFIPLVGRAPAQPAPVAVPAAAGTKVSPPAAKQGAGAAVPAARPPTGVSPPAPPAQASPPAPRPLAPAPTPAAVTAFRTAPATAAAAASAGPALEATNGSGSRPVLPAEEIAEAPSLPPRPLARPPERHVFVSSRTRRSSSPVARRFAILVGILIVIGTVAAVVIATSGTGTQNSSPGAGNLTPTKPAFDPATVTVAVLNGTNTNQLAHHVADRLAKEGFRRGTIATASIQTLTSTMIGYLPGTGHREDALHVARTLNLPSSVVGPIDQAAEAVACPPPGSCAADVVVTVGSNLASAY